jgi:hypothetical protein
MINIKTAKIIAIITIDINVAPQINTHLRYYHILLIFYIKNVFGFGG